jgi:TPR repeat protein
MFQELVNFSYRRTPLQALGWYFIFLLIAMVLVGALTAVVPGNSSTFSEGFAKGARVGQIVAVPYHFTLGILLIWSRPKDVANILLVLAGMVLSLLLAAIGGLIPLAVLTTRPVTARSRTCEHCAETIASDAAACRYCGREVAPAPAQDDQRRPEADTNRLEYVQSPSTPVADDEAVGSPKLEEQQGGAAPAEIAIPSPQISPQTSEAAEVWETYLEYDANVSEAVERLSSMSPKDVVEFRNLFLQNRDCTRVKEFEDEAIRRVQGSAFVGDAALRQAYESLNSEDDRLGDELVRVVGIIGKLEDLGRTVDQVRKKVAPRENLAGASSELFKCLLADETVGSPEFEEQQGRAAHAEIAIPSPQIPKQTSEAAEPIAHSDSPPQMDSPVPDEISGSTAVAQKSRVPVSAVPRQPSRRALVTAWVLGLVLVGSVGVWLAATQLTPPRSVLNTVAAGPFEDAAAAYGRGDYATALRLFRALAEQGYAQAQYNLGFMYEDGKGVPQNYAEAVKWYRLAAGQGYAQAQNNLGVLYEDGHGVPKNDAEAVKWWRLAADQGVAQAQSSLGDIYSFGQRVPENYAEAVKWYRLAANQGNATAQFSLGCMSAFGQGVPKNDAEAVRWFRLAADQGYAPAQSMLGVIYDEGRGMPQNYVNAHMWFNLAAAQGYQDAVKNRDLVEQRMTPSQVAEAQKLTREWKPTKQPTR